MKTYHVGGINPIRRCKSLAEALQKANTDDIIELHKNITVETTITISKDVIINGNGNTVTIGNGIVGLHFTANATMNELSIISFPKANAVVFDENANLTNVTISIKGPVRDFLPIVWFKAARGHSEINCDNVSMMNAMSDENTHLNLTNSHVLAYYGDDICLDKSNDASKFFGTVTATDSTFTHSRFLNALTVDNCTFYRYNGLYSDFTLTEPTLSLDTTVPKLNWKKENKMGLLTDKASFAYNLYITGSGTIDNYHVDLPENIIPPMGFVLEKGNLTLQNCHLDQNQYTHDFRTGSVAFRDISDQNFYDIKKTNVSRVNTIINSNHHYKTAMERLDELIGMTNVKDRIRTILNTIKMNQNQGSSNSDNDFSYHMIFAGNPGVGKTVVARILAQALYEIGAVPENKFKAYEEADLLAGYKGQTAEKAKKALHEGKGGVIFIDEAYTLQTSDHDSGSDFQAAALAQLIAFAENNRSDTVVILAGYNKEMQDFMASNIGISRRFQWIQFEDYTPSEMADIFELMLKSYNKTVPQDLKPLLPDLFNAVTQFNLRIPDAKGKFTNGGNGGLVRNIMQATLEHYNNRRIDDPTSPTEITKADLMAGEQAELDKAKARATVLAQ